MRCRSAAAAAGDGAAPEHQCHHFGLPGGEFEATVDPSANNKDIAYVVRDQIASFADGGSRMQGHAVGRRNLAGRRQRHVYFHGECDAPETVELLIWAGSNAICFLWSAASWRWRLLGGAGFYIYQGWSRNAEQSQQLNDIYAKLSRMSATPLQPGNDKIDNMKTAKEQEQQLRDWIDQAAAVFMPLPPIPQGEVTSKTFATALGTTIYQLQQEAKDNSVGLPPQLLFLVSSAKQHADHFLRPGAAGPAVGRSQGHHGSSVRGAGQ